MLSIIVDVSCFTGVIGVTGVQLHNVKAQRAAEAGGKRKRWDLGITEVAKGSASFTLFIYTSL